MAQIPNEFLPYIKLAVNWALEDMHNFRRWLPQDREDYDNLRAVLVYLEDNFQEEINE